MGRSSCVARAHGRRDDASTRARHGQPNANAGPIEGDDAPRRNRDRPPAGREPPHSAPAADGIARKRALAAYFVISGPNPADARGTLAHARDTARLGATSGDTEPSDPTGTGSQDRVAALKGSARRTNPSIVCLGDIDGPAQLSWQDDQSGGRLLFRYGISYPFPPRRYESDRRHREPRRATRAVSPALPQP